MKTFSSILLAVAMVWPVGLSRAQEIWVRVSVKHVIGPGGVVPSGHWMTTNHWRLTTDLANAGNARMGRGFRYLYPDFEGGITGFAQYYDMQDGEEAPFEYAVRTNAVQSRFRQDALNVYVVQSNGGTVAQPNCRGWASNPAVPISPTPPYNTMNGRIAVFCAGTGPESVLPHEFGHHMGLIHTWVDDEVADTPVDSDPGLCPSGDCACVFANTLAKAAAEGWSAATITVMTNNLMSYHCDINDDFDLSEGQLDKWADTARRYLASEMTGISFFVDKNNSLPVRNGYSSSPFRSVAEGVAFAETVPGNIVVLRPGSYNEQLTIDRPVTLRATRHGWATIGR